MKLCLILLMILSIFTSCTSDEDKPLLILRYADNQPAGHPAAEAAKFFASMVENKTDGRIVIKTYANGELGTETEIFNQLRFGGVDFSRFSLGSFPEPLSEYYILMYPFLYEDSAHMWRVLDGEIGDSFLAKSTDYGFTGLTWFDAGARSFYTDVPVASIKDMEGLRIRIQDNNEFSPFLSLLGISCQKIEYENAYSALKTGRIDGADNNISSYVLMGHHETAKHFLLTEHMRIPEMMVISKQAEEAISEIDPSYMDIIRRCARQAGYYERQLWTDMENRCRKIAEESGCIFTVPDEAFMADIEAAMAPLYQHLSEKDKALIKQIKET